VCTAVDLIYLLEEVDILASSITTSVDLIYLLPQVDVLSSSINTMCWLYVPLEVGAIPFCCAVELYVPLEVH
jgi:hypothetical protein